jgi:predicted DNA-binding transcriptional regulator AlpA
MHGSNSVVDTDALLTEAQTAQLLRLSTRTLQAWRLRKTGPSFIRAGRAVRYSRPDISDWVASQRVASDGVTK